MAQGDTGEGSGLEQSFAAALRAARSAPDSDDAWDHLEELADQLQRPDEVAQTYADVLGENIPEALRNTLSQRAVRFHDEWFGDNPEAMHTLLTGILAAAPDAQWAFERLTVVLTVAERWSDLLGLYDDTLRTTRDSDRRQQLLDDAAHVAKDFADEPGRAVDYLQARLELDPANTKLVANIERLLARQSRWEDLIELWQSQIPRLSVEQARNTRVRIATVFLDHLESASAALDELRVLLDEMPGHSDGCAQLERILDFEAAPVPTRLAALALLRTNYDAVSRGPDLIAVLERAVQFAGPHERPDLHRDAGVRCAILGRDAEAMHHYAQLLIHAPTDTDARKQLRQLARRSALFEAHAAALEDASKAATDDSQRVALLMEAADVVQESIGDTNRAIDLYNEVLRHAEADPSLALVAAHRLNELLATTDQSSERLAVLEHLATLERAPSVRRAVLGEAGRLADDLGDPDRALRAWGTRLDESATDLEALDSTIDLLEKHQRWDTLVDSLRRRATVATVAQQSRADLVRVAEVQERELSASAEAIDTWLTIRERFGDQPDAVSALDRLMTEASRFSELVTILDRAAQRGRMDAAGRLTRMGNVYRKQLKQPDDAIRAYRDALGVDPTDASARAGLRALLDDSSYASEAAEILSGAYRITDDWEGLLELVEIRVTGREQPMEAIGVLREAASLHEHRRADPAAAQSAIARCIGLDPYDTGLEHELLRLAESTDNWAEVADTLRQAVQDNGPSSARAAHLYTQEGKVRELKLRDHRGATQAYVMAAEFDPESLVCQRSIVRVASVAGDWTAAVRGLLHLCATNSMIDTPSLTAVTEAAALRDHWTQFTTQLEQELRSFELSSTLQRAFEIMIARWYRDYCNDKARAEAAARRAVELDPRDIEPLTLLAGLQRKQPSSDFVSTLLALDAVSDRNLDALHEAAEVALALEASGELDASVTDDVLNRLVRNASRFLVRAEPLLGQRRAESSTIWARERLVERLKQANDYSRAIEVLLSSARLPLAPESTQQLRIDAAQLMAEQQRPDEAIGVLLRVLEERPTDLDLVQQSAALCEQQGRILELVVLRRRELELCDEGPRRLALRLKLSDLAGQLERQGGRVESLRENLSEEVGHPASIEALVEVLSDKGRFSALADLLTEQAQILQDRGDAAPSAALWSQVATLVETQFADQGRAIAALRQVVQLHPTHEALDDLARLHLERDEPGDAARWLEQRLQTTDASQQVAVRLRLARAQIDAERPIDAISTLELAFQEAPRNAEIRKLLLGLYRDHEQWQPLAHALSIATEYVGDNTMLLAYAREAAALYHDRLGQPDQAVPVLERAHALAPEDRKLRSMLAEGLRVAGRLEDARDLLQGLIEDFGRRRSFERAAAHLELARVAHAQGDTTQAIDQLELASKMDSGNPTIMRTLAEMAGEAGDLERAERAYRALLIQVRHHDEELSPDELGPAAVLIELSAIALSRGQSEQAEELVESALEALVAHDSQAALVQRRLAERKNYDLLLRVLQSRLKHVANGRRNAQILGELADLYEGPLDDAEQALTTRLRSLDQDPGSPVQHERTHDLCARIGHLDRYIEHIEGHLERARRNTDLHVRCELLLRLGDAMLTRGDLDRAAELLEQAEATEVREVDVWRAAARLAGARGDTEQQVRLLERLASLGEDGSETRADALYRMAEVHLAHSDGIDDGLETLRQAMAVAERPERAARILRRSAQTHPPHPELLELYDQIARRTEDPSTILHAIEHRAAQSDTTPEYIQDGVAIAIQLDARDRAEALMLRAVELSQDILDGPSRTSWALLGLSQRRLETGDVAGAVKWLREATETAPRSALFKLGRRIADVATNDDGDLSLAAKIYESLLERDPTARAAWEPLATIYRSLGDVDRLHRLVDETLDGLQDMTERNTLRLSLAQSMLAQPEHESDALQILRNILLEDPDHALAQALLVEHLQRTGSHAELVELLRQQLMQAQSQSEPEAVAAAALRLGQHLENEQPADAASVYREALDQCPHNPQLLRALLTHLDDDDSRSERAERIEALIALEPGESAAELAMELAELHRALGNPDAALTALVDGHQRQPDHPELRTRLERTYEDQGDFQSLAQMLLDAADAQNDSDAKLTLMRQAVALRRDRLDDLSGAISILEAARVLNPDDPELNAELISTLVSNDRADRAVELLGEQIDRLTDDDPQRIAHLLERADLNQRIGNLDRAIEDLERVHAVDRTHGNRLTSLLEQRRQVAIDQEDLDVERAMTLRWARLQWDGDHVEAARDRLTTWCDKERKDADALTLLQQIDRAAEDWEAVVKTSARLIAVASADAQAEAASTLVEASFELDQPDLARPGLEHARRKQPEHRGIRQALIRVYEATQARAEWAQLLVQEAADTDDIPMRLDLLRRAANLHIELGDTDQALPLIAEIIKLAPDDLVSSVLLIDAHMSRGDLDPAEEALERAIEATGGRRSPELSALLHRKARIAGAREHYPQQLALMEQAFTTDKSNGQIAAELADLAEALEEYDLAVKVLRTITVLEDAPISRFEAFLRQSKIALRRGDRQRAVLWARKAKHEDADNPQVAALLAELGSD